MPPNFSLGINRRTDSDCIKPIVIEFFERVLRKIILYKRMIFPLFLIISLLDQHFLPPSLYYIILPSFTRHFV